MQRLSDQEDFQVGKFQLESKNDRFKPKTLMAQVFRHQAEIHAI